MATARMAGAAVQPARVSRGLVARLVFLLVMAGLLFAGYVYLVLHWSYATGERAGWVQQLSRKGWVCKTWEGEMAIISMPGTAPEKFHFTVWDEKVAEEINRLNGHRVSVRYDEKVGIPSSCFGDTRYYVTQVRAVDEIPLAPGIVVPVPREGSAAPASPAPGGNSVAPEQGRPLPPADRSMQAPQPLNKTESEVRRVE